MSGRETSADTRLMTGLEELLAGNRGRWVIAALLRDTARRKAMGYRPPAWTRDVLTALERVVEPDDTRPAASGTPVVRVDATPGEWVSVAEGAAVVGLGVRRVRQLIAAGAVISRPVDRRTRLVDLESLKSVHARQKETS